MSSTGRFCAACGHDHGMPYIWESYPRERKAEIRRRSGTAVENLQDPAWVQAQLDKGVTMEAINVFRALVGVGGENR